MVNLYAHAKTHRRKISALLAVIIIATATYLIYFRYYGVLPQATINLFQEMPKPLSSDTIIIFSPHEDDEALGVGGFTSEAVTSGAKVIVVFATDGNAHHLKAKRHTEAVAADKILGVSADHIIFYDYPDKGLVNNTERLDNSIIQTLGEYRPTYVFVTDQVDRHPDHSVLGSEVKKELKATSYSGQFYTYLIHYREFPRPQLFQPHLYLLPPIALLNQNRQWLKYDLSETVFDKKNEAILQYKSQLRTPFLHSLMLSFVRQNEIFSKETP